MLTYGPVAPGGYSPRREGVVPDDLRLGKIERELSVRDEVVRKHHEDKRVYR